MFGRREQLVALVIAAAIVFGLGFKYAGTRAQPPDIPVIQRAEETGRAEIKVHVAGEVGAPGVYLVVQGARVQDVVELARPLASADLHAMNLAAPLQDGQRVVVPRTVSPDQDSETAAGVSGRADPRININTADRAELERLPGIGPALADRIIKYREQNGHFMSVEDLVKVSGIGEQRLEGLRDMATVY
ncbi:MAG: ComEA family DNA-binding protein [Candidatus Desulforudis sp.]|nr:ComEA family DNA-binding protein [Desulforudis sp.]